MNNLTKRQKVVLATLAAERGATFAPVQVQKAFFLLDKNISREFGGAQFSFKPYDYGPFDRDVYVELSNLAALGLVTIEDVGRYNGGRRYSLTPAGEDVGSQYLGALSPRAQAYIKSVSTWVRSLSFAELVGAIYKSYPDMKVNSIFKGA